MLNLVDRLVMTFLTCFTMFLHDLQSDKCPSTKLALSEQSEREYCCRGLMLHRVLRCNVMDMKMKENQQRKIEKIEFVIVKRIHSAKEIGLCDILCIRVLMKFCFIKFGKVRIGCCHVSGTCRVKTPFFLICILQLCHYIS